MEYGLVLRWLALYLVMLGAGLPLAALAFPRLADRGAGLSIALALAVLGVVGYWVGHVSLAAAPWVGVALLVAGGAFDPAVTPLGGEKFLDFGLLKSLLRAGSLPPEDMWFAGEPVQYYYGGHMIASLLTRLAGTEARFAYNLALAGFYAALVTAIYGLAGALGDRLGTPRRSAGALGAFFVGIASNLSTPGRLLLWLAPDGVATAVAGVAGIELERLARGPEHFHYWTASRVIEGTINEFPLFAWLNGDLHAHMMSTPLLVFTAGLLFSYSLTPAGRRWRRRALVFGAVPAVGGLLAVVNTWTFPTVAGLTFLAVGSAPAPPATLFPRSVADRLPGEGSRPLGELRRIVVAGAVAAAVVAAGVVWSVPFWLGTASGRSVSLFPSRSSLGGLLLVHGAFLLVFVVYLTRLSLPRIDDPERVGIVLCLLVAIAALVGATGVALLGALIVVGWALLRTARPGAVAAVPTAASDRDGSGTGAAASAEPDGGTGTGTGTGGVGRVGPDVPGFETVLFVAGAGLVLLVEFAYVKENAGPERMNTVFKTYSQVWVLWSLAAGAALSTLVWRHGPDLELGLSGGRWRTGFRVLAAMLVVSTSIYAGLATADQFGREPRTGEPSLDALAFVALDHPDEAPAIEWLDRREGQPNMVSAPGTNIYQWTNAPASLTGIPTVAGWNHEVGYRGRDVYRDRVRDVETIYQGAAWEQVRLLKKYDVEYIYVGPRERTAYGNVRFGGIPGITVAEEFDAVTIYRVDQSELPDR
ncbi:hypothetical protein BRC83_05730 [Halobacteriales archaeon QS_1_68_17]|nr:MAG: hypothetical protein BRC83_05730 [Halobacteriales archaeon QS_1_68_17]